MMRVKICGITRLEDAIFAQESGADALGFIFYRKSKRYIDPQNAAEICAKLNPFISKVGVFVDEQTEVINNICIHCGLTHVQLHGQEPVESAVNLIRTIIKALHYSDQLQANIDKWKNYHLLIDSGTKEMPGGTGKTLPWDELKNIKFKRDFILAGGLNVSNVKQAIKILKPAAVDVNSGVELAPGIKDHASVKKFIDLVKGS